MKHYAFWTFAKVDIPDEHVYSEDEGPSKSLYCLLKIKTKSEHTFNIKPLHDSTLYVSELWPHLKSTFYSIFKPSR